MKRTPKIIKELQKFLEDNYADDYWLDKFLIEKGYKEQETIPEGTMPVHFSVSDFVRELEKQIPVLQKTVMQENALFKRLKNK